MEMVFLMSKAVIKAVPKLSVISLHSERQAVQSVPEGFIRTSNSLLRKLEYLITRIIDRLMIYLRFGPWRVM